MNPPRRHRLLRLAVALGLLGLLSACQTVQPWERGTLATYGMRPDRDPLAGNLADHVFFTREATSGGAGVGGGGCGCN